MARLRHPTTPSKAAQAGLNRGIQDELPRGAGFAALVLSDLPICRPDGAPMDHDASFGRVATRTCKRQDRFESCEDFVASLIWSGTFG